MKIFQNSTVEVIDLSNNSLKIFPSFLLNLKNLKELFMSGNGMTEIQDNINRNSKINLIFLSDNKFSKFPYVLSYLPNLSTLYLNDNGIIENNLDLSKFFNLDTIEINNNQFSGDIILSRKLRVIFAENNNFNSITVGNENNDLPLRTLRLSQNKFDCSIFDGIKELKNLAVLELKNNINIDKIPQTISKFTELLILDISGTSIKELPSNIFKLSKLEIFNIYHNPQLNLKIINFNNIVNECNFINTPILCYQQGACWNTYVDDNVTLDDLSCTKEQIDEIINSQIEISVDEVKENEKNNGINFNSIYTIIGSIIVIVIIPIIIIIYFNKILKFKENKSSNNNSNEQNIYVSERVIILPNNKSKLHDGVSLTEFENLIIPYKNDDAKSMDKISVELGKPHPSSTKDKIYDNTSSYSYLNNNYNNYSNNNFSNLSTYEESFKNRINKEKNNLDMKHFVNK